MMLALTILALLIFATAPGFAALVWAALGVVMAGVLGLVVLALCAADATRKKIGNS